MPRYIHNSKFDRRFDELPGIIWYPYVGVDFEDGDKRLMVWAHNVPVGEKVYRQRREEMEQKRFWTATLDEYTYTAGWWTKAFRSFVKGATALDSNFNEKSDESIIQRVDSFVRRIAYINFIQGLVLSERQIALADTPRIELSKSINAGLIRILEVTHCICWGRRVFSYLSTMPGYEIVESRALGLRGFGYGLLRGPEGRILHVLKVYHPSMPGFFPFSPDTHRVFASFFAADVSGRGRTGTGKDRPTEADRAGWMCSRETGGVVGDKTVG